MPAGEFSDQFPALGRLVLNAQSRRALVDGQPITLGPRGFDVLWLLVDAKGSVVSREQIMDSVWANSVVEDNTLNVHINSIRKSLKDSGVEIQTVPGRGYRASLASDTSRSQFVSNIPTFADELIGREAAIADVLDLLETHRIVTLIGAGGIGKTRLALEVAHRIHSQCPGGARVTELESVTDARNVDLMVAGALGLKFTTGSLNDPQLLEGLATKEMLIILDGCEQVVEEVARLVSVLAKASPKSRFLSTSRLPLRIQGENVYMLSGLRVPEPGIDDPEALSKYEAVRFFLIKAKAAGLRELGSSRLVQSVASICRRLDGIPLALELASARAASLGVDDIDAGLSDRFNLLTDGARSARPRHRTLKATLDWSYELLSSIEKTVFRRLSIFRGSFTLDAAMGIANLSATSRAQFSTLIAEMVVKSLVSIETDAFGSRYRLLETNRAYGLEKAAAEGEYDQACREHASYFGILFGQMAEESRWDRTSEANGFLYCDDARSALDWGFSATGDVHVAIKMTVALVPLWFQLGFIDECRQRVEQALKENAKLSSPDEDLEVRLQGALASTYLFIVGADASTEKALEQVLGLSEKLQDKEYVLRGLHGLFTNAILRGEPEKALGMINRFERVASEMMDVPAQLTVQRLEANASLILGNLEHAQMLYERFLRLYPPDRKDIERFQFDQIVAARTFYARNLWLLGYPSKAMAEAAQAVDDATKASNAPSLALALSYAGCQVSLFNEDAAAARRYLAILSDLAGGSGPAIWKAHATWFSGELAFISGQPERAVGLLSQGIAMLEEGKSLMFRTYHRSVLIRATLACGDIDLAASMARDELRRCEHFEEQWSLPEIYRVSGEVERATEEAGSEARAEEAFSLSIQIAKDQGANGWLLRSAASLCSLRIQQGRVSEALQVLRGPMDNFPEPHQSADMVKATILLQQMQAQSA